ncbi:hypothetical protein I307_03557 [Cryptococcus deuterogattii 99/473]|uniref:Mitochondrial PGP phosphatase n=1 Tax=Cryptococcus deuterogattii Ram5 TaxID=1296110 RepID=A0A0D0V7H1_9TREE|nr:hypothetical protein I313_00203 [Cryptococcus deuterogattii Ram5]KIY57223.1 hypothetical protein I307_03557 [Cryptococcus deuterogattii 99/473]
MAPAQLSNTFIYLAALFKPALLRPHLRVPSIANVDFKALKKEGFNAVVIDKDNCLTLPHKDDIYPPYQKAWTDLLSTFGPGRVLVVSNSAGTTKDPGSIAAEAVSLSLRAPVLLHPTPKPGCSANILSYFSGKLGQPTTLRHDIASAGLRLWKAEKLDEKALWGKWENEIEGPLLGGLRREQEGAEDADGEKVAKGQKVISPTSSTNRTHTLSKETLTAGDLRILVIGDRLFTDTLLADRLSRRLPPLPATTPDVPSTPRVLSIYTTSLPQPRDVRPLRWLEEKLSQGKTKGDYSNFFAEENALSPAINVPRTAPSRWAVLRWLRPATWREISVPPLTWNPRSWKPLPLAVAIGNVTGGVGVLIWKYTKQGGRLGWSKGKQWFTERKEQSAKLAMAKELESSTSRGPFSKDQKVTTSVA